MGDVKPWLWGKNPCFVTLLFCHLFVSPNLVNLFNAQLVVEELWLGELLLKWWWLWQSVSLTHLPTPPTTPCLPCLFYSPHVPVLCAHRAFSPWPVHYSHHDFGLFLLTHRFWGRFWVSHRFSSSPPRVAEHPRTANSRPSC